MHVNTLRCVTVLTVWTGIAAAPVLFDSWTPPVNLGTAVNSPFAEVNPFVSKDGLSLYFSCLDCPDGFGGFDLYVSQRTSRTDPWGPARNLGPTINTAFTETNPEQSHDGRQLFFTSNRPGGSGLVDLYVARRHNKRDDFGWQDAENLGTGVNSPANDRSAAYFDDERDGSVGIYFSSDRVRTPANDIYRSVLQPDHSFGPAVMVAELSTPFDDDQVTIRKDGLELFLQSNRPGSVINPNTGQPSIDIWASRRATTAHPWSEPVNLGSEINGPFADGGPAISWDGTSLYFASGQRPGNVSPASDIWLTTRSKDRKRQSP